MSEREMRESRQVSQREWRGVKWERGERGEITTKRWSGRESSGTAVIYYIFV